MTIEKFRECKVATDGLIDTVKNAINNYDWDEKNHLLNDFSFKHNGIVYSTICDNESNWDDEGKYQYKTIIYQLVSYDKNITSYPCDASIIDKYNVFMELLVSRSGSYFTEYYYTYEKPNIQIAKEKFIPEHIIPACTIVEFENIK